MKFQLKLTDIELKNFRLFEHIKVNFDEKLTVLIGENGAGKTALLEGIAKSLTAVVSRLRKNTTAIADYATTDVRFGQKYIVSDMNLEQVFEDTESEDAKKYYEELEKIDAAYQARIAEIDTNLNNDIEKLQEEQKIERQELNDKLDKLRLEMERYSVTVSSLEASIESIKKSNLNLEQEKYKLEQEKKSYEQRIQNDDILLKIRSQKITLERKIINLSRALKKDLEGLIANYSAQWTSEIEEPIKGELNDFNKVEKTPQREKELNELIKLSQNNFKKANVINLEILQETKEEEQIQIEQKIQEIETKVSEISVRIGQLNNELSLYNKTLQDVTQKIDELKTQKNKYEGHLEGLDTNLKQIRDYWEMEYLSTQRDFESQEKDITGEYERSIPQNNIRYRLAPTFAADVQIDNFEEENLSIISEIALKIDKERQRKGDLSIPVLLYYPCERIIINAKPYEEDHYRMDILNTYDHSLDGLSLDYQRFLDWFDWQDRKERFNGSSKILGVVKKAILEMLNDDENTFEDLYIDPSTFRKPRLIIKKGDSLLEVSQMSSGEKSLLILVSDLARRLALATPLSNDPLKEGQGIVLIDEIDLHLHPRWQRKVIGKLQEIFPKIQWVVTTHSPQVLGEVENGKTYMLDNQEVRLLNFNTYGKDMNRLLDRIMGVPERNSKILAAFDDYFELIERNELAKAEQIRKYLETKIGTDEPLFRRADGIIKRKQLIGR